MSFFNKIFTTKKTEENLGQILIVDPVEIAAHRKENSKSKQFNFNEIELALLDIYKNLSNVPPKIIEKISFVIVINPSTKEMTFTDQRKIEFLKKVSQLYKESDSLTTSKRIFEIFQKALFIDYTNDPERVTLLNLTRNKTIAFFDITLSRAIINHLQIDPSHHNIVGYRKMKVEGSDDWVEIDDVFKYISIAYSLTVENLLSSDEDERLKRSQEICDEYFQSFLATVKLNSAGKFCLIVNNDSVPNFPGIRQALDRLKGGFFLSECTTEGYYIPANKERLIVKSVDKLPKHKLGELCSIILNEEYRDKLVILQASKEVDLADFPEFSLFPFWSLNKADEIFQGYLEGNRENQNIIEKMAEDIEQFIIDDIGIKQKDKILKEIKELKKTEQFANPKKYNFWYKYQSLNFPSVESRRNKILEELEKYFQIDIPKSKALIIESKDWIKFEHQTGRHSWDIYNKNGTRIDTQPYKASKGIKYIAWLAKYHNYPAVGIKIQDLVEKIDKWDGSEKTKKYKTDLSQLVKMYIRKDLEKTGGDLSYLYPDFKISAICSYEPLTDLKILIDDEDMHPIE